MSKDVDILHHIGLVSQNLDQLAAQYERLGFTLTPLSMPRIPLTAGAVPEPLGAGNRTAIFATNYLELLGIVDRARWDAIPSAAKGPFDIDRPLSRYAGLHVMHFGSDDLDRTRQRLETAGLQPSAIRPFQRPVETPTGSQTMRARSLSIPPAFASEALFQVAQHETPELVLQPRYMNHANGARAMLDIIICVDDATEAADRYARISGGAVTVADGGYRVALGRSDVIVCDPAGLRQFLPRPKVPTLPFLAGFTVSADLSKTKRHLAKNGIRAEMFERYTIVGPEDAGGSYIRFSDQG